MAVGGRYAACAFAELTVLRDVLRFALPIELWYLNDADLPPHLRQVFQRFDVEFRDASQVRQRFPVRHLGGLELKPYALLHSRFAEVLLLDADNVPLRDPSTLFDDPRYRESGALFWPDISPANPHNPIWSICGIAPPNGWERESGQMVVDKRRQWPALQLTVFLNEWSDFYYQYVNGDKDTFLLAWRILNAPFAVPETQPARVLCTYPDDAPGVPPSLDGLWQHDFEGRRLFLHHTDIMPVAWGRNLEWPDFPHQDAYRAALGELRQCWDGYLAPPPAPSGPGTIDAQVRQPQPFLYIRRGFSSRRLELNPGGRVGNGAQAAELFWRLERIDEVDQLVISSRTEDTCRLRRDEDGVWRGRWIGFEQTPVELIPLEPLPEEPVATTPARPSLLYVTPVQPADTGNGLAMRAASVLRSLLQSHRVTLLIVPLYPSGPSGELPADIRARCVALSTVVPPAPLGDAPPNSRDSLLRRQAWTGEVGRVFARQDFDVIHVFRLATVPYAQPYLDRPDKQAVAWHLDLDDIESRTQRSLTRLHARMGEPHLSAACERRATAAAAAEDQVLTAWDRVYVCSELDRTHLLERPLVRRAEIVVLPNRVPLPPDPPPAPRVSPLTLLLIGTLGYAPNTDAAHWLCREILPVMREQASQPFRVLLVGTGAPASVRALGHIPEVDYVGPVPDPAPWYRQADIVVVPLRAGGGTRIKILEALAHRRPVVSTSIGAEGLELEPGRHLLIADRAHHFARECLRLLYDPALAARLADDGREFLEQRARADSAGQIVSVER